MRPPRPYPTKEVSAGLHVVSGQLEVFAPSFSELITLEERLLRAELGGAPPGGEGDFTSTLFDLSAVIADVLGVYQDFYGGEAFLATARTEQSLVRHGRRVGYTTDPGVAATGVVAVNVKPGLAGRLAEGIPLLSLPKGEQATQDYQTLDARNVDSKWNSIEPAKRTITVDGIPEEATSIDVVGLGLDLAAGESILLVRVKAGKQTDQAPFLRTLIEVGENPKLGTTTLTFSPAISDEETPLGEWRVLAKPSLDLRLFGWDADPQIFPPAQFKTENTFKREEPTGSGTTTSEGDVAVTVFPPVFGYEAFDDQGTGPGSDPNDLYLADALDTAINGGWVLRAHQEKGTVSLTPYFVTSQSTVSVSLVREEKQTTVVTLPGQEPVGEENGNGSATKATSDSITFVKTWISASATAIRVKDDKGEPSPRQNHDVRSRWLAGFKLVLQLPNKAPNDAPVVEGAELLLPGDLTGLEPGMLAVLATRDNSAAQLIELTSVAVSAAKGDDPATTAIVWKRRGSVPDHPFTLADTVVLGNVVRVSHGKAVNEALGDSDGVTPFLRFALKKSPVTQLADALGAVPELEVRVGDVLWQRVFDFSHSGPEDRHYLVQRDEAQVSQILFGDGRKGAIPPAGRRTIRASYRRGLGRIGNVDAGRLSRLEKAHPLISTVRNPLPVAGGAEPASLSQIRVESTRFIRTFDRAVSASDFADLALLFPGVARSRAVSTPSTGVTLTVADAEGHALVDAELFRAFLDARRDRGLPLHFEDPKIAEIVVHVRVEHDPAFFDFQIERGIREALTSPSETAPGLFAFRARAFGEPAFLSQVYAAVNGVEGVTFSEILIFDLVPNADAATGSNGGEPIKPTLRDAISVSPHEWIHLDPANLLTDTGKEDA